MNDYPTDEQLTTIARWDNHKDYLGLIDYIEGFYPTYGFIKRVGKKIQTVTFVTGGWSGCEDIIRALDQNTIFNMVCWQASFRGGKHVYKVRNITK